METSTRCDPLLYSQRLTPVTTFLQCLFQDTWVKAMKHFSPDVWRSLENSYVNFSHFTEEIGHKDAYDSLTADGLLACFFRGCAIQCKQGQPGIDMVIPMAVLPGSRSIYSPVSISHISAIIFQIKNKGKDARLFGDRFSENKFDLRHIQGILTTESLPYVGIWMSLGVDGAELCIEGCPESLKHDCNPQLPDYNSQTRETFRTTTSGAPT
jgi:hypothetical protein